MMISTKVLLQAVGGALLTLSSFPALGAQQQTVRFENPKLATAAVETDAHARRPDAAASEAPGLSVRERYLLERLEQLEQRLAELETRVAAGSRPQPPALGGATANETPRVAETGAVSSVVPVSRAVRRRSRDGNGPYTDLLRDVTLNFTLDGYYGYNFNRPVGRVNLLRAYDVLSNSFSLNQAAVILERLPDPSQGRRFGVRLDLQYGQATETLQGSAVNEPRPQVYRPIFQAYGTYVVPVGRGLTLDFGKWSSALGFENNYTKDQINYSRSYLYNFLPFYHFGFRANYTVGKTTLSYWLVNGVNQSEDFNSSKSQAFLLTLRPTPTVSWNLNYYTGVEGRDVSPALNPGLPALPTQPGLSTQLIQPALRGRLHILDTYVSWNATSRFLLAGEFDYVVNRPLPGVAPSHVTAGAAYARYRFTPKVALSGRAEYLSDRGDLFSRTTQALKETTLTADYTFADGFLVRTEWRRDFSNRPFFLTRTPDVFKKEQNTVTLGLVWWFGGKQGTW